MNRKQLLAFEIGIIMIITFFAVAFAVIHKAHGEMMTESASLHPWKGGWDKCPCFTVNSYENTAPQNQTSPNWSVEIHLPQNGANVIVGTFNDANMTFLKQNPAIMAVYTHTTSAAADLDYCQTANYILLHQGTPEYLNKLYNMSRGINLTNYVYPIWCQVESGPNPIDGNHSGIIPVPEFSQSAALLIFGLSVSVIIPVWFVSMKKLGFKL